LSGAPAAISAAAQPRLPRGVRLQFDRTRGAWVILAPERVLFPDAIAFEILHRCDGTARVEEIASELSARFAADLETVRSDVIELLQELAEKGFIQT
jgi:pyrroloquinoline quinone biosynthesis protein D